MKIKIMTSKAIAYVKNNIKELKQHYLNRENPQIWLKEALKEEAFIDTDLFLELEDFQLELDKTKLASSDAENIKRIYSNFIELNDSFASDERLWAGLSHTVFYDYVLDRFPLTGKNIENDILNHFFFRIPKPRCYMVNTLSRLWWIGRLTYCQDKENKYELLDYISHDINGYAFTLYGSNWSNNKETLTSFFNAIFAFEKDHNISVNRELFNDAIKYVQCLTGKMILDACDSDYIFSKVYDYLVNRNEVIETQAEADKAQNIKRTGIARLDKIIRAINNIGGIGDMKSIFGAFSEVNGGISDSDRNYIRENIKAYSPDVSGSESKGSIFYKTRIGDAYYWRVSNDYLTVNNILKRKEFVQKRIERLDGFNKQLFNILNINKKDRFTISEIMQYKMFFGDSEETKEQIYSALKLFRENAIIEYLGSGEYKKSFKIISA